MQITKIEPKTLTYRLSLDKDDEWYTSCTWIEFVLDLDAYRLTITGDCGDYTYWWGASEHETFIHLMSRINEDYLLGKIASRCVFNISESKAETLRTLRLFHDDNPNFENATAEISDLDAWMSEEEFYHAVVHAAPQLDFEEIPIVKDFPQQAVVAAHLFISYIQPELKKLNKGVLS